MLEKIKVKIYKLLRWSEKHTKTDMVYLAKGGFWITFGQSINSILSLLLVIAFANLLPKETYGLYRYILAIASILNIFTLTGMNSAVTIAIAAGNDGALRASVRYQFKWNVLMFSVFLILGVYYIINNNLILSASFFILGLFVPATMALNTYGAYLEGKKKFKIANIASIISTFVYIMGVFIAILFSGKVIWLIFAYAFTTFLTTLLFYIFVLRKFKPPTSPIIDDTLKYGRELSFLKLIGPIVSQIDKIILAHFWGPSQLAIYSLAKAIPDRVVSFTKNWVSIGFPKFATKTPKEINTVFYRRIFHGMSVGVAIAVLYILISPYLFKYLLPQYSDGAIYSQFLAMSLIFAIPNRYLSLLFVSQKLSKTIFTISLTNNFIAILLYIVLGVWGGIFGLVIASVLNSFFGMLINIIIWRKKTQLKEFL